MRKLYLSAFLLSTILISCSKPPVDDVTTSGSGIEKTPFSISVEKLSDFSGSTTVEKSARITASSSVTLTSKSAGEISKISLKEGVSVRPGATVALLRDTVNNFDLRLEQAENAVSQQEASIASTEANMNTSIEAARISLARAKLAYESATGRKNIQSLTLSTTNQRTIESYNILYKNYLSDIERQMTQMLYSGDRILGITTANEGANDPWEDYLGVRIGDSKALATNEWNSIYTIRGSLRDRIKKAGYISPGTAQNDLEYISSLYDSLQKFADAMIYMIQNNVIGAGLSGEMQAGWVAEWNGIRSQLQASISGYGAWRSQVLSFLKTYEATEKATDIAIASLTRPLTAEEKSLIDGSNDMKVTYENTRLTLRDSIENARLGLEQAQSSYDNALTVKNATLTQMRVMRENSKIALAQAQRDYAKLAILAPVDGTITKLLVNVGDTVNPGTPIAEFSGKKPEVVIDVDPDLANDLSVGEVVSVKVDDVQLKGTIVAFSRVSGENLLSSVRISVEGGEKYIGRSATIIFQKVGVIDDNTVTVPIDAVRVVAEGEGEISTLSLENTIVIKNVKINSIGGEKMSISGDFSSGTLLITSDVSAYDPLKHILTLTP